MKIFQNSVLAGMAVAGARFMPRDAVEENIAEMRSFMRHAKRQITLVAGGLESTIYERPEMIGDIERLLVKGVKFRVLLGPQKWDEFEKQHPNTMKLFNKYADQVEMYIANEIPKLHFAVIDDKHLLYEEDHPPGKPREVYYEYANKSFAKKLNRVFEAVIRNSEYD